ncbi:hypothetical protein ACFO72_004581 [Enterobacter roggenkampii]
MTNLQVLRNTLSGIRKQIPFTTAQALSNVASLIEQGEKKGMQQPAAGPNAIHC